MNQMQNNFNHKLVTLQNSNQVKRKSLYGPYFKFALDIIEITTLMGWHQWVSTSEILLSKTIDLVKQDFVVRCYSYLTFTETDIFIFKFSIEKKLGITISQLSKHKLFYVKSCLRTCVLIRQYVYCGGLKYTSVILYDKCTLMQRYREIKQEGWKSCGHGFIVAKQGCKLCSK